MFDFDFPKQFIVTGTDTGVGKTVVATLLAQKLRATYWKPFQAGTDPITDTEFVQQMAPEVASRPEIYRFQKPLAPSQAAQYSTQTVELSQCHIPPHDPLVIEGVGGILCPLNDEALFLDFVEQSQRPVVVVARSTLGTINHTLLTLWALRSRNIAILGVILNGPPHPMNLASIELHGQVRVIGQLGLYENLHELYS